MSENLTDQEFEAAIKKLATKSKKAVNDNSYHEAKTCRFIIEPFIKALGYDIDNEDEFDPQFGAAFAGDSKKVDYAIKANSKPIILLEAKPAKDILSESNIKQLYNYFTPTKVKIGILTNGVEVRFYTDLVRENVMDDEPFFIFNLHNYTTEHLDTLKIFFKDNFSNQKIATEARILNNAKKIKNYIQEYIIKPSDDFVRFISKNAIPDRFNKNETANLKKSIQSAFAELMQKSNNEDLSNIPINNTLKSAPTTSSKKLSTTSKITKRTKENAVAYRHQNPSPEVQAIYLKYSAGIKAIAEDITENSVNAYFTYRKGKKIFACLQQQANSIRINLNLSSLSSLGKFSEGCKSYGDKAHWGGNKCNYHINLDKNSDYSYAMEQIKIAYQNA